LLLYIVKSQIFIDGNKRTSVIFANHYLISNGVGMIVIPVDKVEEYKKLLVDYYETNNSKQIKSFLKKCYITYNK
jgi:prophage maintenance system killer protein